MKHFNPKLFEWYNNIEEPLKELVFILRNNGFNTESSCGHKKYIQCQYILEGELMRLHRILYNYLDDNNISKDYEINITIKVINGCQYPSLTIFLK